MAAAVQQVELATRLAISDGIHQFYHLIDTGRAASTIGLFTADARLTFGPGSPQPGTIEGEAIAKSMEAREKLTSAFTRHSITNIVLEPRSSDAIAAHYLMVLFRSDDETRSSIPAFVADVEELWQFGDDGWKIAHRLIMPAFFRS